MRTAAIAWERFWFAPQPTATLALVRIAVGALSLAWALSLAPDLFSLYSAGGIVPAQPGAQRPGVWGLLGIVPGDAALVTVYAALLGGSIALLVGLWTRLAAGVVFVALLSFARRNPFVLNDGDALLRMLALFVALAPAGASLSLDRLRRAGDRFWEFPARAPWALRLIQIQLSVVYLSTVWQKARGSYWTDGTAVSYALRLEDLQRFPVPAPVSDSLTLANVATFGTLATELALAVLVWSRRARPWVLGLGVALHLSIEYSLRVGFFSFAMLACYVAFISPEAAKAAILAGRDRLGRRRPPDFLRSGGPRSTVRPRSDASPTS